ncbi:MAG: DUF5982 domain-containing protein [Armatimonas sp.]
MPIPLIPLILLAPPETPQPPAVVPPEKEQTAKNEESIPTYVLSRKLSEADAAKKKEGRFFTAIPEFSSDPVAGQGFGLRGAIYWNGKRTDPLFAYTPYRAKLTVNTQFTSNNAQEFVASYDMPYMNGSRWRMKVDFKARQDPTNLYFGITHDTLGNLSLPSSGPDGATYKKFSEFEEARKTLRAGGPGEAAQVTDALSNRFQDSELMLNVKADYALGEKGRWRVLGGYEFSDWTSRRLADGWHPPSIQQRARPARHPMERRC